MCALARHAEALGVRRGAGPDADRTELTHRRELDLQHLLAEYDRVAGRNEEYRLARYLESLAEACARFEASCPALPLGDNPVTGLHRARVTLCAEAHRVLADGLRRLAVSAPEQL
jgi:arginyl-tRNA synthetase